MPSNPIDHASADGRAVPEEEHDWIRRMAAGDGSAFESLYRRYARRLGSYLYKMLRQPDLVEEALDDTLLVAWQKAGTFDASSRVSTWLLGIAHRKGLKALERSRRHLRAVHPAPATADEEPGAFEPQRPADPEESALRREQLRRLARAIEQLPRDQRAVVELTFVEGRSYAEIADLLGCPVNTVKTRMFHARKRLGQAIGRPAESSRGGNHGTG